MIARWLHPGAWWLWSLSLAAAASQTHKSTSVGAAHRVCGNRGCIAQAAGAMGKSHLTFFLFLGAMIITIRVLFPAYFWCRHGKPQF